MIRGVCKSAVDVWVERSGLLEEKELQNSRRQNRLEILVVVPPLHLLGKEWDWLITSFCE